MQSVPSFLRFVLIFIAVSAACSAHRYVPGIRPVDYSVGEEVALRVNTLHSIAALIPVGFYESGFACRPEIVHNKQESIGEMLMGDRIQSSQYRLLMLQESQCELLKCGGAPTLSSKDVDRLEELVESGYRGSVLLDNLPAIPDQQDQQRWTTAGRVCGTRMAAGVGWDNDGFPLGVTKQCLGETLVNNHLQFTVTVSLALGDSDESRYRIVGFTVTPHSVLHRVDGLDCTREGFDLMSVTPLRISNIRDGRPIHWSYSVRWILTDTVVWATRWDAYLDRNVANNSDQIHLFSIFNSTLVAVLLMFVVAMHRRLVLKTEADSADFEESRKLRVTLRATRATILARPRHAPALAIIAGAGAQVVCTAAVTLVIGVAGFLSPANPGGLLTSMLLLFSICGSVGGYVLARVQQSFGSSIDHFQSAACASVVAIPAFVVFYATNWIGREVQPTAAVSPSTSVGLVLGGLWVVEAALTGLVNHVVHSRTSHAPTFAGAEDASLPAPQVASLIAKCAAASTLPFGCVFVEIVFAMDALWNGRSLLVFGYLLTVFWLFVITSGLTAIVIVLYTLEAHSQLWRCVSVSAAGGAGAPIFLYSVFYFFNRTSISTITGALIYFSWMTIISLLYALSAASVGYFAAEQFLVRVVALVDKIEDVEQDFDAEKCAAVEESV